MWYYMLYSSQLPRTACTNVYCTPMLTYQRPRVTSPNAAGDTSWNMT
jgi:hypothetical protein